MRTRNKVVLLTLAVFSLAVAGLVTVEAATNTPAYLYNCSGAAMADFAFNVTDVPDPVMIGNSLNYTVAVRSTPGGMNMSGNTSVWFGRDWSLLNISSSGPGWSCMIWPDGTLCTTGFIWDGMTLGASTSAMLNATGVLSTVISPWNDACNGFNPGYANTDTVIPVELQRFVVD